jgi:hypothetical protein
MDDEARKVVDEILAKLCAPFPESEIDWVVKEDDVISEKNTYKARCFAYVNARAVMQRLDAVFGSLYWKSNLVPALFGGPGRQGLICELSVYLPGIGWITKADAAELTSKDPVKGGASGALKRAAVLFGVGRYLYNLGESYAEFCVDGVRYVRHENKVLRWNPPLLPAWALPEPDRTKREIQIRQRAWRALSLWIEQGGKFCEDAPTVPLSTVAKVEPVVAPTAAQAATAAATSVVAAVVESAAPAPSEVPAPLASSEADAAASHEKAPGQRKATGMTMSMLSELRDLLGNDQVLNLAYLKAKKYLPNGATDIAQLPVAYAEKIISMKAQVKPKMAILRTISAVIAGRYVQADAIFLGKGFIKPNMHWFEADAKGLEYAQEMAPAFKKALDRAAANASAVPSAEQHRTAA